MTLTNNQIYTYARQLLEAFQDKDQKLPVKINFYLQKNKNLLTDLAQDIEQSRFEIAQNYGEMSEEDGQFVIPPEKIEDATKELEDLFNLEQDVNIYTVSIDSFDDSLTLSTSQMEALMFMID